MSFFKKITVKSSLDNIKVFDDGEFWGGSEPYLWPIHFKIDGTKKNKDIEGSSVNIITDKIDLSHRSDFLSNLENPLKVKANTFISSFDENKYPSHGNLSPSPSVSLGGGGGTNSSGSVNIGTIEHWLGKKNIVIIPESELVDHTDELVPIPLVITLKMEGFDKYKEYQMKLISIFESLIDNTNTCNKIISPLDKIDIPFNFPDMFPGIMGSMYILMEEDGQSNASAEKARKSLMSTIKKTIDDKVSEISITNFEWMDNIPELEEQITTSVINEVTKYIKENDKISDQILSFIDKDDQLGISIQITTQQIFNSTEKLTFSDVFDPEVTQGNGEWQINGSFTVEGSNNTDKNDWVGEWSSTWGKLIFNQNNDIITGIYTSVNGVFDCEITASNQIMKGTFTNPTAGRNGNFEFIYKSPGKFIGYWKWDGEVNWNGEWNGWK